MDKYIYLILGVIAVGIVLWQVISVGKENKLKQLARFRAKWGTYSEKEYEYDNFQSISHYYKRNVKRNKEKFSVDDITWNDLDMDSLFMAMNQTCSSIGEEYLYNLLRTPAFDKEVLKERNRLATLFQKNESVREQLQVELSKIGYTRKFSLMDYIDGLQNLKAGSALPHYLHIAMLFVAIGIIFMNPDIGILALIVALAYNIFMYYKYKAQVEAYFVSIGAVLRLVKSSQKIAALNIPEIEDYCKRLKKASNPLKSIAQDAVFIGDKDKINDGPAALILDYLSLFTHIDLIKFKKVVKRVQNKNQEIQEMWECIGILEACLAIASFREALPFYTEPELESNSGAYVSIQNGYHPMIKEPVANSISEEKCVLLTGSNASGKSTFLKTTALCSILAQTVYTVPAQKYSSSFFRVYSSMALKDNLQQNESYYIVEIKSLKRIMDAAKDSSTPILCFVDEVLRGTNTIERIAASSRILQSLSQKNLLCFAATHDIELTHMLEENYNNYHFTEEIRDNDIFFSYYLHKGRATTRNAIKLLGIMGYDKAVIEQAENTAKHFLNSGVWEMK